MLHHNKRHPRDMGAAEVEGFLTHLAVVKRVSASTQNQARSAVLFLYKKVLGEPLPWLAGIESAKRPGRLPVVLTQQEIETILAHLRVGQKTVASEGRSRCILGAKQGHSLAVALRRSAGPFRRERNGARAPQGESPRM